MPHKTIKQAERTFRTAIYARAAQFDMETIHRAETLLIQARSLAMSDPLKSKMLAESAQQIALKAIAKTEMEKTRLKGILSSEVASLVQEYSRDKITLGDIRKRINNATYLIISQRMEIAEVCMRQAKDGLDKEQFDSFPALYARTKQRLSDVAHVLTPVIDQLHYSESPKILPRKKVIR
ncbi:MAG: hypothetical protein ABSA44_03775 [Bacteroidota bacterium]|jgi:hypothetical protein